MSHIRAILLLKLEGVLITRKYSSGLTISVEESKIRKLINPDYILKMDKIICQNGDRYLVTDVSQDRIELMLINRKKISRQNLADFMKQVLHIERADCFETE